ncbi:uncharacterized protein N7498_009162 [Penicillium cinerascens]|uniref:Ubiquitin conjugating enzyme n=1 Tax=Penicillium cinerascens TaxID=70096 RepID=A0A9W9M7N7_9EURO|nr:uncharacterized protein N7498_009162 [Penicillium cinerascens]KAJ5190177.1 hypothetical protein N7498_009162 [Penicillium cinerascens]
MSALTSQFVRRGVDVAYANFQAQDPDKKPPSGLQVLGLVLTALVLSLAMFSVEYTYNCVIATLAAIEDSNPDIYIRVDGDDINKPVDPNSPEPQPEVVDHPAPVTSKLRRAVKHLRSRGGFWSRFRGLSMYIVIGLAHSFLVGVMPIPITSFLGQIIVQPLVSVILSTWHMAWVHIVISEPSPKRFWQRIPSYRTFLKIAPAAALESVLTCAALLLPLAIAKAAGWINMEPDMDHAASDMFHYLAVSALPALLSFLISIPGRVIFIRVAASMLPEENETIVPFDRSFGGKVEPSIVGGSGKIGLLDAWNTFDWAGRVRFVKVIAKALAIEAALVVLAVVALVVQFAAMPSNTDSPKEVPPQ